MGGCDPVASFGRQPPGTARWMRGATGKPGARREEPATEVFRTTALGEGISLL